MILFGILALIVMFLIAFIIVAIAAGGATCILVFGDVIVCVFILCWIIKKIFFK